MLFGVSPAIITVTHLQRQNCYSRGPQAAFREGAAPDVLIQQQDGGRALFPGKEPRLRDVDIWPQDLALAPPAQVGQWALKAQEKGCVPKQAVGLMGDIDPDLCIFLCPVRSTVTMCNICKNKTLFTRKNKALSEMSGGNEP